MSTRTRSKRCWPAARPVLDAAAVAALPAAGVFRRETRFGGASAVPLAPHVRYTENGQGLAIGDALWATGQGLGDHQLVSTDPFDPQCTRFENGGQMALRTDDAANPVVRMSCQEQFAAGLLVIVTSISNRRYLVVDEELPRVSKGYLATMREALGRAWSPRLRVLAEIRAAWARPGTKDGWHASRHFDLTCSRSAGQHDDKTWKDLELPKIFAAMDTTVTLVGSQCLFTLLRSYVDPREAAERYDAYIRRCGDRALREELQWKLAYLREDASADIADYVSSASRS